MTANTTFGRLELYCDEDDTGYFLNNYCTKRACCDCVFMKLSKKRIRAKLKEDIYIKSGTFLILEKEYAVK